MGERGHSFHVFAKNGPELLSTLGHRLAILATNDRWTSFVPIESGSFDDAEASRSIERPLLHVWFDDDFGVAVQSYDSGSVVGELSLTGDDGEPGESDLDLIAKWEELGFLTKKNRAALLKRIADTDSLRDWAMGHGLERLIDLPFFEPMPPDVPEKVLLSLLPKTAIVVREAKNAPKPKTPAPTRAPAPKSWTDEQKRIVALHCMYWSEVWSMNNWKLYNRYKKHLPADQRSDVDRLCDAVATGDADAVRTRVESILSRIWGFEDWNKVIRDPNLVDGEEDEWKRWRAHVEATT